MRSVFQRLLKFDAKFPACTYGRIAGIDEAGRGPLAGPVVAAAVIFFRKVHLPKLNDSKQVPSGDRRWLFWEIAKSSLFAIGTASESEIDTINIYHATRLAMKRAVLALTRTPDFLLIDGNMKLDLPLAQQTVVGGDAKSASIAAASIIAKVYRDEWMLDLHTRYPEYNFKSHKGYATPEHIRILKEIGPCPVHRRSFSPTQISMEDPPFEVQSA